MSHQASIGAKLGIAGTFEFRDKDGNVLKTIHLSGAIPLSDLGLSVEDAQQIIEQENANGAHDCQ
jgi:hypothetical protein